MNGYFILIPIQGEQSGRDILAATGLIGTVVPAEQRLVDLAVAHLFPERAA